MPTPGVEIPITAKVSGFDAAFQKIASSAAAATSRIRASFNGLSGVAASLGASLSVGGLALFVKNTIDAADHINDLSKRTGIAVEVLGGIGFAAEQAGGSLDEAAQAFAKFNLNIAKGAAGDKEASKAFNLIGVSLRDLQTLSPDKILGKVADAFESYEDGPNKAALANAYFGKSYAGILPLLDEGSASLQKNIAYYQKYGGITKEAAKQADEFNDTMVKLKLINQQYARALASELLPSLQAVADQMVENGEKSKAFQQRAEETASIIKAMAVAALYAQSGFVGLGRAIGASAAASAAFLKGDFKGAKFINDDFFAENEERLKGIAKMRDAILNGSSSQAKEGATGGASGGKGKGKAPSLGSSDADDTARKALEGRLKALDAIIKDEQDILGDREHFLTAYYQDDLLGIADYFSTRNVVVQDALAKQLEAYNEQERALRASLSGSDPKERIETETKIADVVNKRADAERNAAGKLADGFIESTRAADAFVRKVEEIAVELAELKGDTVAAGLSRFDLANNDIRKKLQANLGSSDDAIRRQAEIGIRDLAARKEIVGAQLALTAATRDFGLVVDQVGNKQQAVSIAVQSGYLTEIEGLQKLSQINRSRLEDLAKQIDLAADSAQSLVEKMGTNSPEAQAALNFVEQLKLKYQELAQTSDLVAKSFNAIGASSFSGLLKDLAAGKNPLESLKAAGDSLFQNAFGKIADSASQSLFKEGGSLGGFGDAISSLLGTQATGATSLVTAGTALTTSAGLLSQAATAITFASAASGSADAADAFANIAQAGIKAYAGGGGGEDILTGIQGFAVGTPFVPRDMLANIHKGERILTAAENRNYNKGGGGTTVIIRGVNVPPGANTASIKQALRDAGRAVGRENRR